MCCPEDKFVKLIQEREPIYNRKISVNKGVIENLWKEIAMEMNMTSAECKFKWKNLRNSYTRYLRESKVFNTVRPRKHWYLADSMQFLQEHIVQYRYNDYSNDESTSSSAYDPFTRDHDHEPMIYCTTQSFADIKQEIAQSTMTELRECDTQSTTTTPATTSSSSSSPVKQSKRMKYNYIMEQLTDNSSTVDNNPSNISDVEHPLVTFFLSLVPDYEKLSPKRQRLFKENTLNCLHKLLDEQEEEERI